MPRPEPKTQQADEPRPERLPRPSLTAILHLEEFAENILKRIEVLPKFSDAGLLCRVARSERPSLPLLPDLSAVLCRWLIDHPYDSSIDVALLCDMSGIRAEVPKLDQRAERQAVASEFRSLSAATIRRYEARLITLSEAKQEMRCDAHRLADAYKLSNVDIIASV
jgi:hypothetical protein